MSASSFAADSPVEFAAQASGRELAMLGCWAVGAIEPFPFAGSKFQAHWRVHLPGVEMHAPRPAVSMDAARDACRRRIEQWLDGAHLALRHRPDLCICRARASARALA